MKHPRLVVCSLAIFLSGSLMFSSCKARTDADEATVKSIENPSSIDPSSIKCAKTFPFQVCRGKQLSGKYVLDVQYFGKLYPEAKSLKGSLSVYVKLNGKDGNFEMALDPSGDKYIELGAFRSSEPAAETLLTNGKRCKPKYYNNFDCQEPSKEEQDVMFWAVNDSGQVNAWDIEVAVKNQNGEWDSNNQANFKFRINP